MKDKIFYRICDSVYCGDGYSNVRARVVNFVSVKETPCGHWIRATKFFGKKRWVSNTTTKRYAYPTVEEAMQNWKRRKEVHVNILEAKLSQAKATYELSKTDDPLGHAGKQTSILFYEY